MNEDPNTTIKLLLDALMGTLAQLNLKYESIQRSITRIEDEMSKDDADTKALSEIHKDLVTLRDDLRININHLQSSLSTVLDYVRDISNALLGQDGIRSTINIMHHNIVDIKEDIRKKDGLKDNSEAMRIGMIPITRLCRLLQKPLLWAIFIAGLIGALVVFNEAYDIYRLAYPKPTKQIQSP